MAAIFQNLIGKYLGPYVKDFSKDQLNVRVFSGQGE
jgi:hypothetical protein